MKEEIIYLGERMVGHPPWHGFWYFCAEIKYGKKYVYVTIFKYSQPVFQYKVIAELKIPKDKFSIEKIKALSTGDGVICEDCDEGCIALCDYCRNYRLQRLLYEPLP